jgi:hypothetical protein
VPYNAAPRQGCRKVMLTRILQETNPMKRTIRISILMLGIVGTFIAASVQQVPAADGGPILVCPPHDKHCQINLPPM